MTGTPSAPNEVSSLPEKIGFWRTLHMDLHTKSSWQLFYRVLLRPECLATFLFRCSSHFYPKGKMGWVLGMFFWRLNILLNVCEIQPITKVGPGFRIFHPYGLILGGNFGKNLAVYQNVTIGQNPAYGKVMPTVGDNVIVYAGAVIVGDISIGSNTTVGANAVVTRSVPENAVVRAPYPEVKVKTAA